jgi:hypothetical protein
LPLYRQYPVAKHEAKAVVFCILTAAGECSEEGGTAAATKEWVEQSLASDKSIMPVFRTFPAAADDSNSIPNERVWGTRIRIIAVGQEEEPGVVSMPKFGMPMPKFRIPKDFHGFELQILSSELPGLEL